MLEVIVFVCGAVVMMLEMVGSRVLAPYLGTSIVVWTSLIGIILACLSAGYWSGGRLADRNPSYRVLSVIILIAAVFVGVVAFSKSFLLGFLQQYSGSVHTGATGAALLLFAPPSTLLGMVSPYAVKLKMKDIEHSGATVGSLYAISTIGSIFGTFFAGFFLIGYLGTTNILLLMAIALTITSIATSASGRSLKIAALGLFAAGLISFHVYDADLAKLGLYDVDTDYSRILIFNSVHPENGRNTRVMVTGPMGKQSAMYLDDPAGLAVEYTRFYKLAAHFRPAMKKVLMLGGGGYSFPKFALSEYPDVEMEVVEIDPMVTELSRTHFGLSDHPRLKIRHEDARTFLNRTESTYDVVLGDTFNAHYSVPFHLSTIEAVQKIHKVLAENGVVLENLICSIEGDEGKFLRAEYATFKAVFPQVYLFPVTAPGDGARWQNIMLVAFKSSDTPSMESRDHEVAEMLRHIWREPVPLDVPILTDDYAPVDRYVNLLN